MGGRRRNTSNKEAIAERSEKLTKSLLDRGKTFRESDEAWLSYLRSAASFHSYSAANVWLIIHQCPEATAVNSFLRWKTLGRSVRKGERAIWIRAPRIKKSEVEGVPDSLWFSLVPVFDVAQTEPIEDADFVWEPYVYPVLTESVGGEYVDLFVRALEQDGDTFIPFEEDRPYRGQCTTHGDGRFTIALNTSMPELQQLSTMVHEMAHRAHAKLDPEGKVKMGKDTRELIAEAAAYAVLSELGFDSGAKAVPYVGLHDGVTAEEEALALKAIGQIVGELMEIVEGAAKIVPVAA